MSVKVLLWLFLGALWPLAAQNNALIDVFLQKEAADFGTAAYLVVVGANIANETITIEQAKKIVLEKNWGFTEKDSQEPLRAGELSLMLLNALELRGGLLYSLFGGPWYAFKEATYRGWFPSHYSAFRILKGWEVIQALSAALEQRSVRDAN